MNYVYFVDDTIVFASASDIKNVHATVNKELVGVYNWLNANCFFLLTLVKFHI